MRYVGLLAGIGLLLAFTGTAGATTLWGTSYRTTDYYSGAQIWTVDTTTGNVNMLKTYDPNSDKIEGHGIKGFGDIAQADNMYLYVTVLTEGTQSFDLLAKINSSDGTILNTWDICDTFPTYTYTHGMDGSNVRATVNSLRAVGNTLYGIEGGGVSNASLLKIDLDANGDFVTRTDYGNAGYMADGDLAIDPTTGTWYGTFWTGAGSTLDTIDPATGNGTTGPNTGILSLGGTVAGLAFDENGKLWAGSWADRNLYSINSLSTGGNTLEYDLSSDIGGNITGLSNVVPEPVTMAGLMLGIGCLARYVRRRKV